MNKKTVAIITLSAFVLLVAGVSFAAPMWRGEKPGGFGPGIQPMQLTESQQADWKAWQEKNFQLKKERIQLMEKTGYLTKEQAASQLKMMESMQAFKIKNNLVAPGERLKPPFTDEQKADLKKMAEQRLSDQKDKLARMVKAGLITQAQADAKIQAMQQRLDKGFDGPGGPGGHGFGPKGRGPGF